MKNIATFKRALANASELLVCVVLEKGATLSKSGRLLFGTVFDNLGFQTFSVPFVPVRRFVDLTGQLSA